MPKLMWLKDSEIQNKLGKEERRKPSFHRDVSVSTTLESNNYQSTR